MMKDEWGVKTGGGSSVRENGEKGEKCVFIADNSSQRVELIYSESQRWKIITHKKHILVVFFTVFSTSYIQIQKCSIFRGLWMMKDFFSLLQLWLRSYRLTSAWMKKSTEWIPLWVKQLPHLITGEIEIAQVSFFYTLCKLFLNLKSGSSSKFKQRRLSIRFESMSSFKTPIRGKTFLSDSQRRVFKRLLSYSGDILQDLKQHFCALLSKGCVIQSGYNPIKSSWDQ